MNSKDIRRLELKLAVFDGVESSFRLEMKL